MPCFHPLKAWRTDSGEVLLSKEPPGAKTELRVACGNCIGCRTSRAQEWALRCSLESDEHKYMCWTTITYEEKFKPPTLRKKHLAAWLKRMRSKLNYTEKRKLRFFACGEYGEYTQRPHYHAILWGLPETSTLPQEAWDYGFLRTHTLTPAGIAYVAGYVSKKLGAYYPRPRYKLVPEGTPDADERVNPLTGEVFWTVTTYQPPFLQMSRRPGLGHAARKHIQSWKDYAVLEGRKIKVPSYLHDAWKDRIGMERDELQYAKHKITTKKIVAGLYTDTQLMIQEAAAIARQRLAAERRAAI